MASQQTKIIGAGTLGAAAGRTIALNNEGWVQFYSYQINYVAARSGCHRCRR
jgi:hypothetical protein